MNIACKDTNYFGDSSLGAVFLRHAAGRAFPLRSLSRGAGARFRGRYVVSPGSKSAPRRPAIRVYFAVFGPQILRQSILTSEFFQVLLPDDGMFDPSFSRANRSSLLHASFRISASLRILSLGKLQIRFAFVSGFSYLVLHIRRRQS